MSSATGAAAARRSANCPRISSVIGRPCAAITASAHGRLIGCKHRRNQAAFTVAGDRQPPPVDFRPRPQVRERVVCIAGQLERRVLHGMLTASIFPTMVGMLLPGTGAIYRSQSLTFLRPVHAGDTVTAHFVVRGVDRARHRLEIDSWIENEAGERVVEGVCEAGLLRG